MTQESAFLTNTPDGAKRGGPHILPSRNSVLSIFHGYFAIEDGIQCFGTIFIHLLIVTTHRSSAKINIALFQSAEIIKSLKCLSFTAKGACASLQYPPMEEKVNLSTQVLLVLKSKNQQNDSNRLPLADSAV